MTKVRIVIHQRTQDVLAMRYADLSAVNVNRFVSHETKRYRNEAYSSANFMVALGWRQLFDRLQKLLFI